MPKHAYRPKKFKPASLEIIDQANQIIDAYRIKGFDLTLRQLYYQFVSRNWLPNKERSYKRLSSIVSDARLAGLIDWEAIVDRTRFVRQNSHWDEPQDILFSAAAGYAIDRWSPQPEMVEVWIEKDAPASAEQIETIKDAARKCEQDSRFLQAYGLLTYEQFIKHRKAFIKFGRSYWNQRYERYFKGELKAALKAANPENVQKATELGNAA